MPPEDDRAPQALHRLFFALRPDEGVCKKLEGVVAGLRQHTHGRWVARENFHITLAFLGSVAGNRLNCLFDLEPSSEYPFALALENIAYQRRRKLIWIAPRSTPVPLERLVEALKSSLTVGGFLIDARPFRAHLTLGRNVQGECATESCSAPINWTIHSYCLVESKLDSCGARYSTLKTWFL